MTTNSTLPPRTGTPPGTAPIQVLLVDDHPAVRQGIRQLIVHAIAPKGARTGVPAGSGLVLDYDRARRRPRCQGPARS
jgi:hypothetical protein